ncbi:DUF84 family protein [Texcoconibacillus texcoconensis]|uniref:inosine/xanthosine triphosphatase n=1 Tax=Texcoconibacillus texcoconensis TaxID=1095777 RepID=A0A840QN72_9BACI|nr:inosine/xanthosine triphosphatase [Texcoconibacillus texcoconensis]
MKSIVVGSTNRVKINAVSRVFQPYGYEVYSQDVPSFVSEQPYSQNETKRGAANRAEGALSSSHAMAAIGLEGGIVDEDDSMWLCNWGALKTDDGQLFFTSGLGLPIPKDVAHLIRSGHTLGEAIDQWTHKHQVSKNEGTVGILTNGFVSRTDLFEMIVRGLFGQWSFSKK